MASEVYGAPYVATYLGTTPVNIANWTKGAMRGFPLPTVPVLGAWGRPTRLAWTSDQLPLLREWFTSHFRLTSTDAEARWKEIDENFQQGGSLCGRIIEGQEELFSL